MIVTSDEIVTIKNSLKKTVINGNPPLSNKSPIMKEFDNVFSQGYQQYFQTRKHQNTTKSNLQIEIIVNDPVHESSNNDMIINISPNSQNSNQETSVQFFSNSEASAEQSESVEESIQIAAVQSVEELVQSVEEQVQSVEEPIQSVEEPVQSVEESVQSAEESE